MSTKEELLLMKKILTHVNEYSANFEINMDTLRFLSRRVSHQDVALISEPMPVSTSILTEQELVMREIAWDAVPHISSR